MQDVGRKKVLKKNKMCCTLIREVRVRRNRNNLNIFQVDTDIPGMKKAVMKHEMFNGKPDVDSTKKRTNSYKTATGRESVPQWPEETKDSPKI